MSLSFLALLSIVSLASCIVYEPSSPHALVNNPIAVFEEYLTFWNKSYTASEKLHRFTNFLVNAEKIEQSNKASKSAKFGFTKFSDWSVDEFKRLLGLKLSPEKINRINAANQLKRDALQAPSGAIDWVAKGMTTPVKDQGQCGSCWAFSAVETIESANLLAGKTVNNGSPQEIVDCDSGEQGCEGGDPAQAMQWVISSGGLEADSCYPYTAQDGTCASSSCSPILDISNTQSINSDEGSIYTALGSAPLSICCDAEPWQNYASGILTAAQCGTSIDHAIQLTGYSPNQGGYWIVRNSWGADWGENGFIWLQYGQNTCGITSEVTAATA